MNLDIELLPWQKKVFQDNARFQVIAAGRRCGKTHYAAISLILAALDGKPGSVMYVGPTQGLARDLMWTKLFDIAGDIIENSNVNNLELYLAGGNKIMLKGSDRPDTLRGHSLKHLVIDEAAFCKEETWTTILRPALSDQKGRAIFISTPEGRNWFHDIYVLGADEDRKDWQSYHLTTYDNPFIDPEEIEAAKSTLASWQFNQEYMAGFDARGSEFFDINDFEYYEERSLSIPGDYYVACDLAGFENDRAGKTKRRDNSALAVVYVSDTGDWWVEKIDYGRWTLDETAQRIFDAVEQYRPISVGIEKGIAQQAVMGPLQDVMRRTHRVFRIELLSHGNQKKEDRILWALQGRFEHGKIKLKRDKEWNAAFADEAGAFPSKLVHDDLLDALSYIDQMAVVPYASNFTMQDDYEPFDLVAGY